MPTPRRLPDPEALLADAPLVWAALSTAGWSAAALDELLGATARSHLDRDELAPVLRRTEGGTPLEVLARLFVVGVAVDLKQARAAGVPETWLVPDGYGVAAAVRLQPVVHDGVEVLVAHDPGRA
ncbi:MAG: transferase, partial [Frankiales bacterium]|nr:transferase [Frankiales bacterium]